MRLPAVSAANRFSVCACVVQRRMTIRPTQSASLRIIDLAEWDCFLVCVSQCRCDWPLDFGGGKWFRVMDNRFFLYSTSLSKAYFHFSRSFSSPDTVKMMASPHTYSSMVYFDPLFTILLGNTMR